MNMMLWLNIVFLLLAWRCFVYLETAPTTALHHGSEGFLIPSAALSTRHSDWTRGTPWVMSYSRLCPTWCRKVKMEFSGRGQNWIPFLKSCWKLSAGLMKDASCRRVTSCSRRVSGSNRHNRCPHQTERLTWVLVLVTLEWCARRLSLRVSMVTVKLHLQPGSAPPFTECFPNMLGFTNWINERMKDQSLHANRFNAVWLHFDCRYYRMF